MGHLYSVLAAMCFAGHQLVRGPYADLFGLAEQGLLAAASCCFGAYGVAFAFAVGAVSYLLRLFRRYDFRAHLILTLILLPGVVVFGWKSKICSLLAWAGMQWLLIMRTTGGWQKRHGASRETYVLYRDNRPDVNRYAWCMNGWTSCADLAVWILCFILMGNCVSAIVYGILFMYCCVLFLTRYFSTEARQQRQYAQRARKFKRYIRKG